MIMAIGLTVLKTDKCQMSYYSVRDKFYSDMHAFNVIVFFLFQ